MSPKRNLVGAVAAASLGLGSQAYAATVYDELIHGDLSNVRGVPSLITLSAGANDVFGVTGTNGDNRVDLDYLTFVIPAGSSLSSLVLLPGTNHGDSGVSFIAIQEGATVTVDPVFGSPTALLGWAHYSDIDVGKDILPQIAGGFGSIGFTPPLGPGQYSVWIQDTDFGAASYGFQFNVTAVPEADTWAMMLVGGGLVVAAIQRRRRSYRALG